MKINAPLPLLLVSNAVASLGAGVAMIAIPWLLVNREGGAIIFGEIATIVNVVLFVVTPFIGPFIDSNPRKVLMISIRVFFILVLLLIFAFSQTEILEDSDSLLILYYVLGSSFYAFNIPLRSAYVRELFDANQFVKVNAILEIENQIAAVVTGVVAIFVIERLGLDVLATINIACFAMAVVCILAIPPAEHPLTASKTQVIPALADGFLITIRRPVVATILVAATIPYVVVIFYTILHPIALAELPDATGSTYALVELLFGAGAIIGGLLIPRLLHHTTDLRSSLELMVFVFALIATAQALFQTYWGFVLLAAGFGLWNSTTRILRQSILMNEFGNAEVGRVGAFLQSWIMLLRASGIAFLTVLIDGYGPSSAIWFAAAVASVGPLLLVVTRMPPLFSKLLKQGNKDS